MTLEGYSVLWGIDQREVRQEEEEKENMGYRVRSD